MQKILLTLIATLLMGTMLFAQNAFQGQVVYDLSYSGENAEMISSMMPSQYNYKFRGTDLKFNMKGGMIAAMMGDMLIKEIGQKTSLYVFKSEQKKAFKMPVGEERDPARPKVKKLAETSKIQGYDCRKYRVITLTKDGEMSQEIWAAPAIQIKRLDGSERLGGSGNTLFLDDVDGLPLKIISTLDIGGLKITVNQLASQVEAKTMSAKDFEVPSGFEVTQTTLDDLFEQMIEK